MLTGRQIRMARAALDWSLRVTAERAGVHENTVRRIERGENTNPGTLFLLKSTFETAGVTFLDNGGVVPPEPS